jgi:hypothetical protein
VDALRAEISARGGIVEEDETVQLPAPLKGQRTRLRRLVVRW